jgi:hypothetical protein
VPGVSGAVIHDNRFIISNSSFFQRAAEDELALNEAGWDR